ncbi:MAG: thioredoxin-dependent thiol peroxidase [Nitrospinota bacterium]
MKLKTGDTAPPFTLPDQSGKTHTLSDYKGKDVLLYFYPKDNTPGCTKEACAFKDMFRQFKKENIVVLGISIDPVKKHEKFSEKFGLPFPLLSDENKEVVTVYETWGKKKFMGREYMGTHRYSFWIDTSGKIAKIYTKVKPSEHPNEVFKDIMAQKTSA